MTPFMIKALLTTITLTTVVKAGWDGKTMPITDIDGIAVPAVDQVPPINQPWFSTYNLAGVPKTPQTSNTTGTANPVYVAPDVLSCPQKMDWAISYDDGPSEYTDALLNNLTALNTKATFFVVGSRVTERPDLLKKAYLAGHQIAVHTWSHPYLTSLSNEQIVAEMEWCSKIISYVLGVKPRYMRPPYGDEDTRVRAILVAMQYKIIIWNLDTSDWMSGLVTDGQLTNPAFNSAWITGNVSAYINQRNTQNPAPTAGVAMLEHDLYYTAALEAPAVLKLVQAAKYTPLPVGSCLGDNQWYVGQTATMATATRTAPATLRVQNTMAPAKLAAATTAAAMRPSSSAMPGSNTEDLARNDAGVITLTSSIYVTGAVMVLCFVMLLA